ncbi:hypothetical protein JCM3770_005746 [Rhodotorula araucariae]
MGSRSTGPPPWIKIDSASAGAGASPSSSSRPVGLGLGTTDLSTTTGASGRSAAAVFGVFPSTSFGDRENRHPRSPPRIRTASLVTVIQTTISPGTSSHGSPTNLSPSSLRVDSPPNFFSAPASRSSPLHSLLRAVIPARLLPRSISAVSSPPIPYPKSPSLTRPHPSTRHGPSAASRRVCTPRRALLALMLTALLIAMYATSGTRASVRLERRPAREEGVSLVERVRKGVVNLDAILGDVQGVRAESRQTMDEAAVPEPLEEAHRPQPHRAARVEDIPRAGEGVRMRMTKVEKEKNEDAPLPFVAEPVGDGSPRSSGDGAPDSGGDAAEDEQAGLEAVVVQAQKEADRAEAELDEKLEMEKVIVTKDKKQALAMAKPNSGKAVEAMVAVPAEAAAKADAAVAKAIANAKKKARDPKKKDASRYKRLLPLGVPPRRYLYGANFVLSVEDGEAQSEVEDPELTNARVKVPSAKQLKKLFDQGKKRYAEDEDDWRAFEWEAPPADASLRRLVDKLKPEELVLRSWIQRLHQLPLGHGVGLGARDTSAVDNAVPLENAPTFDGGSRDKWAELAVQAQEGHAGKCRGSKWLGDYEKLHTEMLAGKREPKFISYHCEQGINCGGLGDRLLGMTSAFFFGLVTQRAFLAEWQSPIPLDVVFDSPHVNWSHSSYTADQHPVLGQKRLASSAAELDIIHFDRLSVDATFGTVSWNPKRGRKLTPGFERRDLAYQAPWIKFYSNRGMIYRSFQYKHLQKSLDRLGLQPTTAFACISEYLFKPKQPALDLITQYTSVLALPTIFSVGIHIRTGDQSMRDPEYDRVNTVKRHISFFRCARELGETYARKDQRVVFYLVTDSAHLKQDAQRVLGNKLITTDMVPQHVHQKSGHVDGVMNAVVEDWILAKADMLVATQDSGFGKLASFMMAKPNATVTIFPKFNPDVMGLMSKKSHVKVDCTSPTVFTSFDAMSSEWSLG